MLLTYGILFFPSALTNENGNEGIDAKDDGQSKGAGGGEGKSVDDDGNGDGESSDILEQYFSKKQNPSKRKFHVNI